MELCSVVKVLLGFLVLNTIMCNIEAFFYIPIPIFPLIRETMYPKPSVDEVNFWNNYEKFLHNEYPECYPTAEKIQNLTIPEHYIDLFRKVTSDSFPDCIKTETKIENHRSKSDMFIRVFFNETENDSSKRDFDGAHRSKRSIVSQFLTKKLIEFFFDKNALCCVNDNGNLTQRSLKIHRSKRMAALITNARRITTIGASTAVVTGSTIQMNFQDKMKIVYETMKAKALGLIGINDSKTIATKRPLLKIIPSRVMPTFENLALIRKLRNKRDVKLLEFKNKNISNDGLDVNNNRSRRFALLPFVIPAVKMIGVAGTIVLAGTATSFIDSAIKEKYAKDQEERLIRRTIECIQNNFGCLENYCWSNCGPRLASADWCVTTDGEKVENNTIQAARCIKDSDCDKCWSCATSCRMEGIMTNIPTANTP